MSNTMANHAGDPHKERGVKKLDPNFATDRVAPDRSSWRFAICAWRRRPASRSMTRTCALRPIRSATMVPSNFPIPCLPPARAGVGTIRAGHLRAPFGTGKHNPSDASRGDRHYAQRPTSDGTDSRWYGNGVQRRSDRRARRLGEQWPCPARMTTSLRSE